MKYFFILFVALFAVGFQLSAQPAKKKINILTYNIHHGNPPTKPDVIDLKTIAEVIKKSKADLVGIQEVDVFTKRSGVTSNQAAELGRLTGMHHFFVKAIDFRGGAYGVAILSSYPILKKDSVLLPMVEGLKGEPRALAMITVEPVKGQMLTFASTHLELNEKHQKLQATYVINKFKNHPFPVILSGDFNAVPGSETINIFDQDFKRSSVSGIKALTHPERNPSNEIDFVMFKPKDVFRISKHRVLTKNYGSDHLPVLVTLAYSQNK